ncbi:MAG: hypothetical protein IJ228_13600 [Succinivibrio sp.]|nr:hypothetical protein [Succinivibrio sp.]
MLSFDCAGVRVDIHGPVQGSAPLIVLNTFEHEGEHVYELCQEAGCPPLRLAAISALEWDCDLIPWEAPAPFAGRPPYQAGAAAYLKRLKEIIVPEIHNSLTGTPKFTGLAGYSLGGLFALYAACSGSPFTHFASASGSLWYPGFADYLSRANCPDSVKHVYLSLGDKEAATRNRVLRQVECATRRTLSCLQQRGIDCVFVAERGGHNTQCDERMARALRWLAERP